VPVPPWEVCEPFDFRAPRLEVDFSPALSIAWATAARAADPDPRLSVGERCVR
jgi:hypothetical protein